MPPRPRAHNRLDAPGRRAAQIPGFEDVRLSPEDAGASVEATAEQFALPRSGLGRHYDVLAISGGAAGGAFGAGALVGLTRSGRRPEFALVTGVSTGALIAPFAFLGPAWDGRMREAYTGGHAANSLGIAGFSAGREPGLLRSEALERLIYPFIDDALLEATAEQHARGRRLLVATTDLDRQSPCIWDMGAIAARGGPEATRLFRDVLAASASLPGLFPPRRFAVEADGVACEEMHVDGGVSAPLFVLPETLLRQRELGQGMRRARLHVIVNMVLDPEPRTTPPGVGQILVRSFDTLLRVSYRQALSVVATFCAAHALPLGVASIPPSAAATANGAMLNFDTSAMGRMFDAAAVAAEAEGFWRPAFPWPDADGGLPPLIAARI
ncbi:patatin-like phospholipase family protein [uncultured Phenylobacterium sp.]|uniref:patatin-like phospholipase family protein n=1 Tax=uncultured Phenylobacterium sp. TaxID=349273 RepID=UPI0025CE5AB1|nr:patatin-like phospholipase family protein [uncultured Phenylobacterium sp.]